MDDLTRFLSKIPGVSVFSHAIDDDSMEDALALPEDERAALVDALVESLTPTDALGSEWSAEIARRIEAVERGESHLIAAHEVEARLTSAGLIGR